MGYKLPSNIVPNHNDLEGIGANDHHEKFTLEDHSSVDHTGIPGVILTNDYLYGPYKPINSYQFDLSTRTKYKFYTNGVINENVNLIETDELFILKAHVVPVEDKNITGILSFFVIAEESGNPGIYYYHSTDKEDYSRIMNRGFLFQTTYAASALFKIYLADRNLKTDQSFISAGHCINIDDNINELYLGPGSDMSFILYNMDFTTIEYDETQDSFHISGISLVKGNAIFILNKQLYSNIRDVILDFVHEPENN